jgi:hypothetical protein
VTPSSIALVVIVNTTLAVRQEVTAERDAQAVLPLAMLGAASLLALGALWPLLRTLLARTPAAAGTRVAAGAAVPVMAALTRAVRAHAFSAAVGEPFKDQRPVCLGQRAVWVDSAGTSVRR